MTYTIFLFHSLDRNNTEAASYYLQCLRQPNILITLISMAIASVMQAMNPVAQDQSSV